MRALGFFFAVFLSMLSVFLIATGEVRRWFQPSPSSPIESAEAAAATHPPGKNLLEFDFYDVEEGRRKFSMRAHLSQGEFQVESKLDQIPSLTLEDGTLEVPLPETGDLDAAAAPSRRVRKLVLEFESAVYERGSTPAEGEKPEFQVFLRRGNGTLDDGTKFHFEDLVFTEERKKDPKDAQPIRFSSRRPASVENGSFELASPSGFEGRIVAGRVDRFTFHAPVSALLDTANASALPVELPMAPQEGAPAVPREPGGKPERKPSEKLAVTSQGPLDLEFIEATDTSVARAVIRFRDDVKLFPVSGAPGALQSIARPEGKRLECEHLQIDLEERNHSLVPVRALASMVPADATAAPASLLRIFVQNDPSSDAFRIEGDSLEWLLRQGAEGESSASAAVLHGKPHITGGGLDLHAGSAVFHVEENRLVLTDVRGAIEQKTIAEKKSGKRGSKERPPRTPSLPELGPIPERGGLLDPQTEAPASDEASAARAPAHWDLVADEAELLFDEVEGSGTRALSRLVARSARPDGVEIRSREEPADGTPAAPATGAIPIVITGNTLTYIERDKRVTLEGTEAVKPRFAQGENRLESRRIHVHIEEGIALFEEQVQGKIEDAGTLVEKNREGARKEGSAESDSGSRPGLQTIEIEAESLAVRIEEKHVQHIRARGPSEPVRLLVRSGQREGAEPGKETWWRFVAPELFWDNAAETAQLAGAGTEARPRIEFEEGSIEAGRVRFDRARWKAELSQGVTLALRDGARAKEGAAEETPIVVSAGRAEVDFFPGFEEPASGATGPLRRLSVVKRLRAWGGAPNTGDAIRIQGPAFAARAEECEWDAERRELRFRGNGMQEIEVLRDDLRGPVRAREIVFDAARKLVTLSGAGGVTGRLVQTRAGGRRGEIPGAGLDPANHRTDSENKDLVWDFETSILEIALREAGDAFELVSVTARDKVHLENSELGAQLLGDDLHYDYASRRIRVFSPNGRPQTLICSAAATRKRTPPPAETSAGGTAEKSHKITSQEIWVIHYTNSTPAPGEPRRWVLATFEKDVIATFHVAPDGDLPRSGDVTDTWKMVSERLAVHIDPSEREEAASTEPSPPTVRWAVATGNVDFSSGTVRATCDKAVYEGVSSRLTLLGSPARLSRENRRVFEDPEIRLRKVGSEIEIEHSGRGKPMPPAIPPEMEAPPLGRR